MSKTTETTEMTEPQARLLDVLREVFRASADRRRDGYFGYGAEKRVLGGLKAHGYVEQRGNGNWYLTDMCSRRGFPRIPSCPECDLAESVSTPTPDPTGLRPECAEAEALAHAAKNIVADQEQRDADRAYVARIEAQNVALGLRPNGYDPAMADHAGVLAKAHALGFGDDGDPADRNVLVFHALRAVGVTVERLMFQCLVPTSRGTLVVEGDHAHVQGATEYALRFDGLDADRVAATVKSWMAEPAS